MTTLDAALTAPGALAADESLLVLDGLLVFFPHGSRLAALDDFRNWLRLGLQDHPTMSAVK
jgi:hypothetical protein